MECRNEGPATNYLTCRNTVNPSPRQWSGFARAHYFVDSGPQVESLRKAEQYYGKNISISVKDAQDCHTLLCLTNMV